MKKIDIDECHSILLNIMTQIHSICINNDIPYYMLGGSMLGAIRHNDFIPWDDDFDIGIERKYYDTFLKKAEELLPKYLKVGTHDNSNGIFFGFAKIQDTRTILFERAYKVENKDRMGINIDIFPLDSCDNKLHGYNIIRGIFRLHRFIFLDPPKRKFINISLRRLLRLVWPFKKNLLIKAINKLISIYTVENGDFLISYWSIYGKKTACPKIVWGKPTLYKFNNFNFFGPANYDKYLSLLFNNYLELPPAEKSRVHSEERYWKTKPYKVGYTTGVFDMFHIGHLNILKKAKENCDYLIVGVTTDELSINQKGKKPIIPYSERMIIVESIKYVDKVVPQTNMDKITAWENHKFNIMFVGSDWKGSEKWNILEQKFKPLGVEIIYFPYTQNTSSTYLRGFLEKIMND